jgi:hypothetical protein
MKKVCAIISIFNEEDIIREVVDRLILDGIDVYVIDNASTDSSVSKIQALLGHGVVDIVRREYFDESGKSTYKWSEILKEKESISLGLNYDWYIHADADEIRLSPWHGMTLQESITRVDLEGYNAINFKVYNFRPIQSTVFTGCVEADITHFESAFSGDLKQVKCWKNAGSIDLASSGGHFAKIPNLKVYPVRFILKHYPLRSKQQSAKKLYIDRAPRFAVEEIERDWHRQYDALIQQNEKTFEWDESGLQRFDFNVVSSVLLSESAQMLVAINDYSKTHAGTGSGSDDSLVSFLSKHIADAGFGAESAHQFTMQAWGLVESIYRGKPLQVNVDTDTAVWLKFCIRLVCAKYFLDGDPRILENAKFLNLNGQELALA